jgi:hypothetical protein
MCTQVGYKSDLSCIRWIGIEFVSDLYSRAHKYEGTTAVISRGTTDSSRQRGQQPGQRALGAARRVPVDAGVTIEIMGRSSAF